MGTKTAEILSARACIGALLHWASSTIRMMPARRVSDPTLVALNVKDHVVFNVPATTFDPMVFSDGIGSPVIMDSSIYDDPSVISPSTGILLPGFTMTRSPNTT